MPPPPLLGYNNNVRHRRRIFHIQTEDSGVNNPLIRTHLFADGGRIVKSTRTDYSEHLESDDMKVVVKNLMKEQHKGMFVALRSGELDDVIGFDEETEPPSLAGGKSVLDKAADLLEVHKASKADETKKKAPAKKDASTESSEKKVSVKAASESRMKAATPEVRTISINADGDDDDEKSYAASRPASIFSVPPPHSTSIFGQGLDEKSLDDAILSYLAEDPVPAEAGSKKSNAKSSGEAVSQEQPAEQDVDTEKDISRDQTSSEK